MYKLKKLNVVRLTTSKEKADRLIELGFEIAHQPEPEPKQEKKE